MHPLELKVPPLVLFFACAVLMTGSARGVPGLRLDLPYRVGGAFVCAGLGFLFLGAGLLAFRKARTTVDPTRPENASQVVTQGIYAVSRNPMYVGFLLVLLGWAWYLSHGLSLFGVPFFYGYMNRFQIEPEERFLAEKFGSEYRFYLKKVRRWL